ncbi:hypothetical protein [Simkania sp.]|uniref:hypothetical protein n=1 Tax=Simkania sp. TaxID=34094 RepID=UPI003B516BC0
MKKLMTFILFTTFIITGCVQKSGTNQLSSLSETSVDKMIQDGVTTKQDILNQFGVGYELMYEKQETWVYRLSEIQAKSLNFIPLLNLFYHGNRNKTSTLTITYDSSNIVCHHEFTQHMENETAGIIPYLF